MENNTCKLMFNQGYVPVISLKDGKKAAEAARAMVNGEASLAEVDISSRGLDALKAVCGVSGITAGTTVTGLEQCRQAVDAGAKFVFCEKWNKEMLDACTGADVLLIPTCKTLAAVMEAQAAGMNLLHYIPAKGIDNLSHLTKIFTSYPDVKFVITVTEYFSDIDRYMSAPFVFAVRGCWLQALESDSPNYADQVTALCEDIFTRVLGFELFHLGINMENAAVACQLAGALSTAFRMKPRDNGPSSRFVGSQFEVMKRIYRGEKGHFAIGTNNVDRAIAYVRSKGYDMDMDTAYVSDGRILTVYMKEECSFGGFAAHFTQKNSPWPR